MVEQAERVDAEEYARSATWTGLRVITAMDADPRDAEIAALRVRIAELEACPQTPGEILAMESGDASDAAQQRMARELAAQLLADAWAEAQEIKRQARTIAEQTKTDLAAEAEEFRATLTAEREEHDAAMTQERERHEMALRTLTAQRDRVIEQIAVLCRGMADAAHRAHEMTQEQSAVS